jgi:hypothetical protein
MTESGINEKMGSAIRWCDVFGQPIGFYLNGKAKHNTVLGGSITICMFLMVILIAINSLMEFFDLSDLTTSASDSYSVHPEAHILTNNIFPFSIGHRDKSLNFGNSVFSFNLYSADKMAADDDDRDIIYTPIPLVPCVHDNFIGHNDEFDLLHLERTLCPQPFNITITGGPHTDNYAYLKINVSMCVNGSNPYVTCASPDFITNYFQTARKIKVTFYFLNSIVANTNYANPLFSFIDSSDWLLNPGALTLESTISLMKYFLQSDSNDWWGWGDQSSFERVAFLSEKDTQIITSLGFSDSYMNLNLKKSNFGVAFQRKYKTMGETVALVAGFWNFSYITLGFLAMHFNRFRYKAKLADKIYEFDVPKQETLNKSETLDFVNEHCVMRSTKNSNSFNAKWSELKTRTTALNYNYWDLISKYCCCCLRRKRRLAMKDALLEKALSNVAVEMDITLVMRRLNEFDKLKRVFFNKEQLKLFDFIPPPVISIKSRSNRKEKTYSASNISDYLKHYMYYCNLSKQKDHVTQNLLTNLDEQILSMFRKIKGMLRENNLTIKIKNEQFQIMEKNGTICAALPLSIPGEIEEQEKEYIDDEADLDPGTGELEVQLLELPKNDHLNQSPGYQGHSAEEIAEEDCTTKTIPEDPKLRINMESENNGFT